MLLHCTKFLIKKHNLEPKTLMGFVHANIKQIILSNQIQKHNL